MGENCGRRCPRPRGDPHFGNALVEDAGFIVLGGNLFDAAIMKTSVISKEFRTATSPTSAPRPVRGASDRLRRAGGLPTIASMTRHWISTRTACCSSEARARWANPAAAEW